MGVIQKLITKHREKVKTQNEKCNRTIERIDDALKEINTLFFDDKSFVEPNKAYEWHIHNEELVSSVDLKEIHKLKKTVNYKKLLEKQKVLYITENSLKEQISIHNDKVAKSRIAAAYQLIGDVEGRKLDGQQMTCIVKDVRNHLVIAGAGTGKTTTVIGKIKYLLKSHRYLPEDILVLSFTNASASEMSERINKETGCNIEASTFHKLGLNIITAVEGVVPKITQLNMRKFIKENLMSNMETEEYLNILSSYLLYNKVVSKSEFEFKTKAEYDDYDQPPVK